MEIEETNFASNIEAFVSELKGCFVYGVALYLDPSPVFDKTFIPFNFEYALQVVIVSAKGNFRIFAAATSEGEETFWADKNEVLSESNTVIEVKSIVKNIELSSINNSRCPFRLVLEFDDRKLFFYCAEIYINAAGKFEYVLNDEMILVFDDSQEAVEFEEIIKFG
jgi:hypothetical protein